MDTSVSGRKNLKSEIPDDLMATNSKLSPKLPNVIIEEIKIAIGIASVRSEALAYHKNSAMVSKSRSLPTRSSIYFHRLCIISIKNAMKKVAINGPMKDLRISLSIFFIIYPIRSGENFNNNSA